jgi:lactoylglutathione lyase
MKLSHIAFWTNDADRLKAFYGRYFDTRETSFDAGFLDAGGDARLEIMQASTPMSTVRDGEATVGLTHIAFEAKSRSVVDGMRDRFLADGVRFEKRVIETEDGYYEFAVFDPDGNIVEISCRIG